MSNFVFKNGHLYCNNCENKNIPHEVYILLETITAFEIEFSELRKPMIFEIKKDSPIELYCECCKTKENIIASDLGFCYHC